MGSRMGERAGAILFFARKTENHRKSKRRIVEMRRRFVFPG
jgi:hypothetical protein